MIKSSSAMEVRENTDLLHRIGNLVAERDVNDCGFTATFDAKQTSQYLFCGIAGFCQ